MARGGLRPSHNQIEIAFEDDLNVLEVRLNLAHQLTYLVGHPNSLACRFDDVSGHTPWNRVLKAAVLRLLNLPRFTW